MTLFSDVINLADNPINDASFRNECKLHLDQDGALVLDKFIFPNAIDSIKNDGIHNQHLAYYTSNTHNIYLSPSDPNFSNTHPRNRLITSSKGCITTDQIPKESVLHILYSSPVFKEFLCAILGEQELYEYADPLSGVTLHYASEGQELGWHFDNSSFAITLLVEKPVSGGVFEYVKDVRNADAGEMNYQDSADILDGKVNPSTLRMEPGALVLFRGKNSMHRVTPTQGDITRMLAVLAYNTKPDVSLSESARLTFFGRLN